ncbi:uncharacterized protein LOC109805546 [Cajanus cajan]|uniref:uncharacterized protein LOC109805546 n=1 Tax=Cajanus cajan TaxID=3821 RepID=UPI00098D8966|nr:uncharacterized protein LOC109805546 [Cajanus cajan]
MVCRGDFNAVRVEGERRGVSSYWREDDMKCSDEFIIESELVDLPLVGRKYTWYKINGKCMSRLDRFLVSNAWLSHWPHTTQWGLSRGVSDHCAILLKNEDINWGPKPFRVLDCWRGDARYAIFVRSQWKELDVEGRAAFVLKEKLKLLKCRLRWWNQETFGCLDRKINEARNIVNMLDLKSEDSNLQEVEVVQRKEWRAQLCASLTLKDNLLFQKSRLNWLQAGDANSKFFHACINHRRLKNEIRILKVAIERYNEPSTIKEAVKGFFEGHFCECLHARPRLQVFLAFLHEFHANGKLVKGSNNSFVVLVPKTDNPQKVEEYRPISLIGCMYKVLAKVLANRMKKVIGKVIYESQSSFFKGRLILDSVLIANEILEEAKRKKKQCLLFKVDFEKAYDSVNWEYIFFVMEKMRFPISWRRWIAECLATARVSVLVNGSPSSEFGVGRGLRQGDPLALFLYLITVEGLSSLMSKAVQEYVFTGYMVGGDVVPVSHLQYADDTILVGDATLSNGWAIKVILQLFELVAGLKVNFFKSQLLGVNVDQVWVQSLAQFLNCKVGSFPCSYLGLPLGVNPARLTTWQPVVRKVEKSYLNGRANYCPSVVGLSS